jgi:glycosyltransferase involved in cell wall biosynthesis
MKDVSIYNPTWDTFGGGEKYVCTLADVLSTTAGYAVTLLIDKPGVTKAELQRFFNMQLDRVNCRKIASRELPRLMESTELGIIVSNFRPFGNHAQRNIYILQIPYAPISGLTILRKGLRGALKEAAKDIMRMRLLREVRRADLVLVYSRFVQNTLEHHYRLKTQVLYPAIDSFPSTAKERAILSVGRFFTGLYNDKRYDILIDAFKQLCQQLPDPSWEYWIAGSCSTDKASQRHLASLKESARGYPIVFHVNCSYDNLRRLYGAATLFWHAAGYGIDEQREPDRMEHFGMTTVEAMSASCVPLVINKGGQREIVSHGESGYLWQSMDELITHSLDLIRDPEMVHRMRDKAAERAKDFDKSHFTKRLLFLLQQLEHSHHDQT